VLRRRNTGSKHLADVLAESLCSRESRFKSQQRRCLTSSIHSHCVMRSPACPGRRLQSNKASRFSKPQEPLQRIIQEPGTVDALPVRSVDRRLPVPTPTRPYCARLAVDSDPTNAIWGMVAWRRGRSAGMISCDYHRSYGPFLPMWLFSSPPVAGNHTPEVDRKAIQTSHKLILPPLVLHSPHARDAIPTLPRLAAPPDPGTPWSSSSLRSPSAAYASSEEAASYSPCVALYVTDRDNDPLPVGCNGSTEPSRPSSIAERYQSYHPHMSAQTRLLLLSIFSLYLTVEYR
jgi:hypothetical protein